MRQATTAIRVVKVEKLTNSEIVYNFSVEEDESYVANGVVSHNCRCRLAPATDELPDIPDAGEAEFNDWLDSREG